MNRKIKFQAWVPALNIMLEDVDVYANGTIGIRFDDLLNEIEGEGHELDEDIVRDSKGNHLLTLLSGEEYFWIEAQNHIKRQFTGLLDKYGKEVYEHDLTILLETEFIDPVVYSEGAFGYIIHKGQRMEEFISFCGNRNFQIKDNASRFIEVVGNIYQNPKMINSIK